MKFNLPINRVLLGTAAMWNAEAKWHDRDGLPIPPTPKLVLGMRTILRRWVDKKPSTSLSTRCPMSTRSTRRSRSRGRPGSTVRKTPPWALHYVVYFCDPQTGSLYTFVQQDRRREDRLRACWKSRSRSMRALRGANVVPVVHLDQRQMKTKNFGMKSRPHFKVVEWKVLGGDGADSAAADAAVADAAAQRPDRCSGSRTEPCSECGSGLGGSGLAVSGS